MKQLHRRKPFNGCVPEQSDREVYGLGGMKFWGVEQERKLGPAEDIWHQSRGMWTEQIGQLPQLNHDSKNLFEWRL